MPIVFSFHGAGRNGDDYRDFWIDMANQHGFMVFAPRFSSSNYPGFGDNYLMGNVFEDVIIPRNLNLTILTNGRFLQSTPCLSI